MNSIIWLNCDFCYIIKEPFLLVQQIKKKYTKINTRFLAAFISISDHKISLQHQLLQQQQKSQKEIWLLFLYHKPKCLYSIWGINEKFITILEINKPNRIIIGNKVRWLFYVVCVLLVFSFLYFLFPFSLAPLTFFINRTFHFYCFITIFYSFRDLKAHSLSSHSMKAKHFCDFVVFYSLQQNKYKKAELLTTLDNTHLIL